MRSTQIKLSTTYHSQKEANKIQLSKSRKNVESHDKEETTFEKELNISAEIKAIYENPKPTRDPVFKKHTELTEIFS